MKYYHVCTKWDGLNLESLYKQHGKEAYDIFATRWPEAGELAVYHVNVIHLHATIEDAQEMQSSFGGEILVINDPDGDELDVKNDTLEYSHPVVMGSIDADYVSRLV